MAFMLRMAPPAFPAPIGMLHVTQKTTFDEVMNSQIQESIAKSGDGMLINCSIVARVDCAMN